VKHASGGLHFHDDDDTLIKRQQEEIARLRDALTRAERERDRLKHRNALWRAG